jgi:PAS domain S-box-containing protein
LAFDLDAFHRRHKEAIIKEWMGRLHTEVGPNYSSRPLTELRKTITGAYEANHWAIALGDYSRLDKFIKAITKLRLEAGFLLSEVQKAFELYRSIIVPILAEETNKDEFKDCVERINDCLAYTIHRFSDHFQNMHEREILEQNRYLEEEVRSRTSQLAESELKYKTLVEEINDGYFVLYDEMVVFANRAYCQMHGYTLEEVIGKKYTAFVAPESREEVIDIYMRSRASGYAPSTFIYKRLHRDGRCLPTEITAKVATYERRISNIGICRDISKRVEMETRVREAERLAYVGHITTSLSHEIRNPLSAVKMNLQILAKNLQRSENDRRRIDISVREVIRLEAILAELLDYAKPLRIEFKTCNLNPLVLSYLELISARLRSEGLRARALLDHEMPDAELDGERLGQALMNILLNAVEASPRGGRIDVRTLFNRKKDLLVLSISDEGSGVPPGMREEIFKPFFTTKSKGTGLGLANTKRIIEAHQGWMDVGDKRSGGAVFRVFIPRIRRHG